MSSGLKLVLIEDEPSLVKLYTFALSKLGDVLVATTQTEADILLHDFIKNQTKPKVILLDLIIPAQAATSQFEQRAGFEILQWLRSEPWFADVPIIVMTNLDSTEDQQRALHLGANKYIIKSDVVPKDIVSQVAALL